MKFNIGDLGHAIVVGEQVIAAILTAAAGGTGEVEISFKGQKYLVDIKPVK